MALRYYANAPATQLALACTSSSTQVEAVSIAGFPIQFPYTIIVDRGLATEEVMEVTAAAGSSLTVTRGVDGTTAFEHSVNATVEHGISARDIRESNEHVNKSTGVHGLGGTEALVGTDTVQALTNKDLSSATNTFPSTLATDAEVDAAADAAVATARPVGEVTMWYGSDAACPAGWLVLNGSTYSSVTYPALFAHLGTTTLPDFRDRAPVGVSATKTLGSKTGSATVTLTTSNLPAHTHSIDHNHGSVSTSSSGTHWHAYLRSQGAGGAANRVVEGDLDVRSDGSTENSGAHTHTVDLPNFTGTSGSTGSGTAVNVQNPVIGIHFIIRAA